ncbi:ribonuclease H-like domain-containing protein [Tanacetum coccineum]
MPFRRPTNLLQGPTTHTTLTYQPKPDFDLPYASRHRHVRHFDVNNEFLHGDLFEKWIITSLRKYAVEILEMAHMVRCNQCPTLVDIESKLGADSDLSTVNTEFRGLANVVTETCWLRNLLRELHTPLSKATLVYCDSVSVVYLSSYLVQHQRTKYIEIDIHFVRDLVAVVQVRVLHVSYRYQYADIFTKGLPSTLFEEFHTSLSVRSSPAQTARSVNRHILYGLSRLLVSRIILKWLYIVNIVLWNDKQIINSNSLVLLC